MTPKLSLKLVENVSMEHDNMQNHLSGSTKSCKCFRYLLKLFDVRLNFLIFNVFYFQDPTPTIWKVAVSDFEIWVLWSPYCYYHSHFDTKVTNSSSFDDIPLLPRELQKLLQVWVIWEWTNMVQHKTNNYCIVLQR